MTLLRMERVPGLAVALTLGAAAGFVAGYWLHVPSRPVPEVSDRTYDRLWSAQDEAAIQAAESAAPLTQPDAPPPFDEDVPMDGIVGRTATDFEPPKPYTDAPTDAAPAADR